MSIPFVHDINVKHGAVETLSPLVRRIFAPNPGIFTYTGTGTFLVGQGEVAVIDPGPSIMRHVESILNALDEGERISHILVTHTHKDHSPAALHLSRFTGATVMGFGPHGSGPRGEKLTGGLGEEHVEEGADPHFIPDVAIGSGEVIEGPNWTLEALHTPGHTSNHLCFDLKEEKTLFSGDHVMGWSTSIISPPDGDMALYFESLEALKNMDHDLYRPTHGPAIENPKAFVDAILTHRKTREQQVLKAVKAGHATLEGMVPVVYADVDPSLYPAAERSLLAHLIHLADRGEITASGPHGLQTRYT